MWINCSAIQIVLQGGGGWLSKNVIRFAFLNNTQRQ